MIFLIRGISRVSLPELWVLFPIASTFCACDLRVRDVTLQSSWFECDPLASVSMFLEMKHSI